jgi:hypothetical protein
MIVSKRAPNEELLPDLVELKIREILDGDIDPVANLLTRGFPRAKRYWEVRLERLRTRSIPHDMPRYGYMLEADGELVGVILSISSYRRVEDRREIFSDLAAWYVDPAYRSHATQLLRRALSNRDTTYLSLSAAIHVRPIFEALGFKAYSRGQFLGIPSLARNRQRTHIVPANRFNELALDERERALLESQASYGCIAFCCVTEGKIHPFVFLPRTIRRFIPCAQLVYCRNVADLTDVAGSVGRHLLSIGRPFVLVDANGPIPGLPGKYFHNQTPKYYKGSVTPALGDLTETEATIFGIWSPADAYRKRL